MMKMRWRAVPTMVLSLPTIVLVSLRVKAKSLRSCRICRLSSSSKQKALDMQ